MRNRSNIRLLFTSLFLAAILAAGCSGSDASDPTADAADSPARTAESGDTNTDSVSAEEMAELPAADQFIEILARTGASESVAQCQAEILAAERAEPLADLEDFGALLADLDDDSRAALDACVSAGS